MLAGHYLTHFCDAGGTPQVLVAISAASAGVQILDDGRLNIPPGIGGHVAYATGIPRRAGRLIVSAEDAAIAAASATNRRVGSPPELLMPPGTHAPAYARWRIELEAPISVVRTIGGAAESVSEVFVGVSDRANRPASVLTAARTSPTLSTLTLSTPGSFGAPAQTFVILMRAGAPSVLQSLGANQ
jgi:hypothetical protein